MRYNTHITTMHACNSGTNCSNAKIIYACIINVYVPHEVKKSTCISQEDFPNNEIQTRCSNPKGTDVKCSKYEVVLGAPDRVNIPCLMHNTRLCQTDVKMTNDLNRTI